MAITIAVACYLVVSAVTKSKREAQEDAAGAVGGIVDVNGNSSTTPPPYVPSYSNFPREGEARGGTLFQHIGGEGEDKFCSARFYGGKWIVFFETDSVEHDVKEAGLHFAKLAGATLEETVLLSGDERFVGASVTKGGLMLLTSSEKASVIRLFDENMDLLAKTELKRFDFIKLSGEDELSLFVSDEGYIKRLKINPVDLAVFSDNFLYPLGDMQIFDVLTSKNSVIFLSGNGGAKILLYSEKEGFKCAYSDDKRRLLQILPHSSDGRQIYLALLKEKENIVLSSFDEDLKLISQRTYEAASSLMYADGADIKLHVDNALVTLCSHIEEKSREDFFESAKNLAYIAGYLVLIKDGECKLSVNGKDISFFANDMPSIFANSGGALIFFENDREGFGKDDIFLLIVDITC